MIIVAVLYHRYSHMRKQIAVLNEHLNEQNAKVETLQRMMKIPSFKGRFFLTTEYLYNELAEYIQNYISISSIEMNCVIEKNGVGEKKDTSTQFNIKGIIQQRVGCFQILIAGDTIVPFSDIHFYAFERVGDKQKKLNVRIADNGQDSLLKQIVVSYDKIKEAGEIVDICINWQWPNMLNVRKPDYVTLPNFLSQEVHHLKITLSSVPDVSFKTVSIYRYEVGMTTPEFIVDLPVDNPIIYEENNPTMNCTYMLYYEV